MVEYLSEQIKRIQVHDTKLILNTFARRIYLEIAFSVFDIKVK